jgi:hypothetical protein
MHICDWALNLDDLHSTYIRHTVVCYYEFLNHKKTRYSGGAIDIVLKYQEHIEISVNILRRYVRHNSVKYLIEYQVRSTVYRVKIFTDRAFPKLLQHQFQAATSPPTLI